MEVPKWQVEEILARQANLERDIVKLKAEYKKQIHELWHYIYLVQTRRDK